MGVAQGHDFEEKSEDAAYHSQLGIAGIARRGDRPDHAACHCDPAHRKIIGSNVHNEADEDVGKVDEIILPTGGAPTAILAVGGFLGIGSHYVAVPLSRLRMGPRDRWVMQGATKEYLRTLPPFTYTAAAQR